MGEISLPVVAVGFLGDGSLQKGRSSLGREHERLTRGSDRSQNQQGGDLDLSSLVLWVGFFFFGYPLSKRMFSCWVVKGEFSWVQCDTSCPEQELCGCGVPCVWLYSGGKWGISGLQD